MFPSILLIALLGGASTSAYSYDFKNIRRQNTTRTPTPCASLTAPTVPGASIVSFNAAEARNVTVPPAFGAGPRTTTPQLNICDVNITLTHGTAGDNVRIGLWLPLEGWNGRFQGTGGGGFIAGTFGAAMGPAVADGFAAGSTNAGLNVGFDGTGIAMDEQLLTNFASLSVHEMAVVGKAVAADFYGTPVKFSYWNGCSTGGRQGMMEAQSFPEDFDGILAIAPAINWDKFIPAELWPFAVQTEEGEFPPQCVFDTIMRAHIAACDADDGAEDNLISNPGTCVFDAQSIVGEAATACTGADMAPVTDSQARIYTRLMSGATAPNGTQLWFGLEPGASLALLANSTPFTLASSWINNFVTADQEFNFDTLTTQTLPSLFERSSSKFSSIIGTSNPDLSAFRTKGGKILTWHGLADQLIFPNGTFDYLRRVEQALGGPAPVSEFYRVFSAPGVAHCSGGNGPEPEDAMDALVRWVEEGEAPEVLPASKTVNGTTVERNLCMFPMGLMYRDGDVNSAESWECVQMAQLQRGAEDAEEGGPPRSARGSAAKMLGETGLRLAVVSMFIALLA